VTVKQKLQTFFSQKKNLYLTIALSIIIIFIISVFTVFFIKYRPQSVTSINISSPDSIITITDSIVPPLLYEKMPDLTNIDSDRRKQMFINIMLPTILTAQEIIESHRQKLIEIKKHKDNLLPDDSVFLTKISKKLKTDNIDELIKKLHKHPLSIVLAQTAIESGWGTSRFCREANNLFGIWSFSKDDNRIAAGIKRNSKTVYLKRYNNLVESLTDYFYTIGKSSSFKKFREIRVISQNPYRLIWYLDKYSEKRLGYVVMLRNTIENNNLIKYDKYKIAKINKKDISWINLIKTY